MEDDAAVQKAMRAAGYGGTPGKTVEDATEIAAMRRDAERYRFLARLFGPPKFAYVSRGQRVWAPLSLGHFVFEGETIDAAIDAAMQGSS